MERRAAQAVQAQVDTEAAAPPRAQATAAPPAAPARFKAAGRPAESAPCWYSASCSSLSSDGGGLRKRPNGAVTRAELFRQPSASFSYPSFSSALKEDQRTSRRKIVMNQAERIDDGHSTTRCPQRRWVSSSENHRSPFAPPGQVYLQAVVDNFSRKVLAWAVTERCDPSATCQVLLAARSHPAAGRGRLFQLDD